ncbi:hypothetical protein JNUCC1_03529 [Lentibacillus sp. JNUCC-1]|uniref:hypothetical protein n=1 Tax=Lentibacillus sp. JNUCC-1 TaxID=2654513 RepID=UPI0012E74B78|nr:hypothetical protein [Lentibacillus sp. JNUCC-1]MUV39645.1 hypothetical protein [Lentibacillus sp. JNUCC-1]
MPKPSFFINQSGFILPYVVFISALVLIALSASIHMYHNEIYMTDIEMENIKTETLLQMGYTNYMKTIETGESPGEQFYTFPQGRVHIQFVESKAILNIKTTTNKNQRQTFVRPFSMPSEEKCRDCHKIPIN